MKTAVVKVRVKNREELEDKMTEIDLEFEPMVWQHDRVYLPRGFKSGNNMPRMIMRTEMKAIDRPPKYELILKRHIEDSGIDVVNRVIVNDYVATVDIIHQLGFELKSEVSRRRQILPIGEDTRMCLDKVDRVAGYYLKIETKLKEEDKISEVMEDLEKTLMIFGQDPRAQIEQPYFALM
ncbi:CYTH domain-containing protein [Candidatus Saccharibacteria bacterium]|nr:CYTH domain-containing protein [Candidatus Saccharibacteria bacterium]